MRVCSCDGFGRQIEPGHTELVLPVANAECLQNQKQHTEGQGNSLLSGTFTGPLLSPSLHELPDGLCGDDSSKQSVTLDESLPPETQDQESLYEATMP